MSEPEVSRREGGLELPTRHPVEWQTPDFGDEHSLNAELERVFDICHGCRRCFNLCHTFPTLFDAVDESETGEIDSVPKKAYWDIVDHCYLCDMCFMTKCPYVPPHEWNVDFPHLMLRAKAKQFKSSKTRFRNKLLSATETVGKLAGIPVVRQVTNTINASTAGRRLLKGALGVHPEAPLPKYHSSTSQAKLKKSIESGGGLEAEPTDKTKGRLLVFLTCYGKYNQPELLEDLVAILRHNSIPVAIANQEACCGMPKLELGDLDTVEHFKNSNIEELYGWVDDGWDLVAPIPSCVLMFKRELPLLFSEDERVKAVAEAFFDPFEYLMYRHQEGKLNVNFEKGLGKISYQVPCHLRVQNLGLKTKEILELVPDTTVEAIERCSGHDGTYAVKDEYYEIARKIAGPVVRKVDGSDAEHFSSDCPMAAKMIASLAASAKGTHPIQLLRYAYGI